MLNWAPMQQFPHSGELAARGRSRIHGVVCGQRESERDGLHGTQARSRHKQAEDLAAELRPAGWSAYPRFAPTIAGLSRPASEFDGTIGASHEPHDRSDAARSKDHVSTPGLLVRKAV